MAHAAPQMIELPTHEVEIDGVHYKILTLDATRAYPLYCKLLQAAGGVFEQAGGAEGGDGLAARLLGKAMQALSPELVAELIKVFGTISYVRTENGDRRVDSVFMIHFAGRMGHMMGWLFECVKANFADFLPSNLPGLNGADLGTMFRSPSPKMPNGSSTAP